MSFGVARAQCPSQLQILKQRLSAFMVNFSTQGLNEVDKMPEPV